MLFSYNLFSQNLVENPGFENYSNLPYNNLHYRFIKNWKNIQGFTANSYYHRKGGVSKNGFSFKVPNCCGSYQEPHSGDAFASMYVLWEGLYHFAVQQATLKKELIKNHRYYVEIFLNLDDYCEYTTSSFNICFSKKPFPKDETMNYYYNIKHQITNNPDSFIVDKKNWTKISGTFIAKGGEKYVAIGNFEKKPIVKSLKGAYVENRKLKYRIIFYIDDLLVTDITDKLYIEPDKPLVLKNIFFNTGKYKLLPPSYPELNKLANYLKENPDKKIEISGHTDNTGSDKINKELSKNRAKAVAEFLISKGINKTRLTYKGYGSTKPIDTNNTAKGRQNNRRVEVKIIKH